MLRLKKSLSLKLKYSHMFRLGYAVAQLVETLRYRPESSRLDSRRGHLLNLSGRTMALGSTQPLTEMSTRGISWGVKAANAWGLLLCHFVPTV
jgi:hypothetical protein